MVLRQVSLGRPLFRFPFGTQRWAILDSASGGIRHTCPSHLYLLFLTVWVRDFAFVLCCSSSLEILLGQKILRIFRKHLFWKVCILWAILVVSYQHSAPCNKTLSTLLLKMLSLVLAPTCFDFQMFFSLAKDWLDLVILELIYLSEPSYVAILLPRYVKYSGLEQSSYIPI